MAFISVKNLTGYDNTQVGGTRKDYEMFMYDAETAKLACASCNTDSSPPTANTRLPAPVNGIYQQRYLDDQGRLFFSTTTPIVPQDINRHPTCMSMRRGTSI